MKVLIIGAGPAGSTAAFELRKNDKTAEITIIDDKTRGYSPCALPYTIEGTIDKKDIFVIKKESYKQNNIQRIFSRAKSIDKDNKKIILDNGQELSYDKLIIATGSRNFIPPIKGIEESGYLILKSIEDEQTITERIRTAKKAVFIGGGLIGIELAKALSSKSIEVTILEAKDRIISALADTEITEALTKELEKDNIKIITDCKVNEIKDNKVFFDDTETRYDALFVTCGMRANISLAKEAGIETDKGIIVDEHLLTSDKDIYAAGDCVEYFDGITKKRTLSMIGSIAVKEGVMIAKHILGKKDPFPGFLNSTISKIGKHFLGRIGVTEEKAKEEGINCVSATYKGLTKPEYCPDKKDIFIKMVADDKGKIIGVQMLSEEEVGPRINMMSIAIQNNMTVKDLQKTETCYNPMSSPMFDPLMVTAEICKKRLR